MFFTDGTGRMDHKMIRRHLGTPEHQTELPKKAGKIDTKSAIGRFFFTLLGALAEMERALISERTRDALQKKMRDGRQVSWSPNLEL